LTKVRTSPFNADNIDGESVEESDFVTSIGELSDNVSRITSKTFQFTSFPVEKSITQLIEQYMYGIALYFDVRYAKPVRINATELHLKFQLWLLKEWRSQDGPKENKNKPSMTKFGTTLIDLGFKRGKRRSGPRCYEICLTEVLKNKKLSGWTSIEY
jgi:hypothetical protein